MIHAQFCNPKISCNLRTPRASPDGQTTKNNITVIRSGFHTFKKKKTKNNQHHKSDDDDHQLFGLMKQTDSVITNRLRSAFSSHALITLYPPIIIIVMIVTV